MCEIDNAAYYIGLVESVRVRMDHVGRVHLTERQADDLWFGKAVAISMLPWALLLPMPLIAAGGQFTWIGSLPIPFLIFAAVSTFKSQE
jgi:hypothetical protein